MEFSALKKAVVAVEMPDTVRGRLSAVCSAAAADSMEVSTMKKNHSIPFRRPLALAAAAVLCLCLPITGMAMSELGFFRDIKNPVGTVTGTVYEQATGEITVTAVPNGDQLTVTALLQTPEKAPYAYCEQLAIGQFCLLDADGKPVAEGTAPAVTPVSDQAAWTIALEDLASGSYTLRIEAFTSIKKADQPLTITGLWECTFTL